MRLLAISIAETGYVSCSFTFVKPCCPLPLLALDGVLWECVAAHGFGLITISIVYNYKPAAAFGFKPQVLASTTLGAEG